MPYPISCASSSDVFISFWPEQASKLKMDSIKNAFNRGLPKNPVFGKAPLNLALQNKDIIDTSN